MKVEIWSDVMCPFCYIGKRRFENALAGFGHKDKVEIVWKSFQLDPGIKTEAGKTVNEYLAERKGITIGQARQLNERVTAMAAELGLHYDFDKAIVANSFDAHRFAHLASAKGLGDEAEEKLFNAYFTEGKNIADHDVLVKLGTGIGLDANEVDQTLKTGAFGDEVEIDAYEAQQVGARGVPFYVFDKKYGVSGAQSSELFLNVLERAFIEWKKENEKVPDLAEGDVCEPGKLCN